MAVQNFIDGKLVDAADGATIDLVNPTTGEVSGTSPRSGARDIDAAVDAATSAFDTWRRTTPSERGLALIRIADAIEARGDEFIDAECAATGKPRALMAADEIPPLVDQLRFFAGAARILEGASAGEYMAGLTSYVRREPLGVCAQVTPWNYPLMMAVWKIAPALAAGNTVVLKPAETTPQSTVMLAELVAEFVPQGVLNVVCGDRDTGRTLVAHPGPAMVSVTGSVRAGMEVATAAAADLKRVHLELGGNAPCIVMADADVAAAASGIATAGFYNAGQDCTAATRVVAHAAVYDQVVDALAAEAASKHATDIGPLNSAAQRDRVEGFLARLPKHARIVCGGQRAGDRGFFFPPTVVADVRQDDEIVQQ
ncbi:MAG TPA: aldehyde dehydrogenase family protein, partial [Acidimicrobiia bacterium]|nr:aldehyde dehydrogenase family protein [Acidimicrobiia bacterium]